MKNAPSEAINKSRRPSEELKWPDSIAVYILRMNHSQQTVGVTKVKQMKQWN